ncbi:MULTISPECIES: DUF4262 domain-containing protein [Pseudomonas]|uniref:DUF4262 domain-containing protein n=1 Tax=Pseudomonas TaxID=286 RepID=UPI00210DBD72|nr:MULTISPECIES: DUF4262 domain-containing protein [Pseudomonas]
MACASSVTWGQYAHWLQGEVGQAYADFVLGGASIKADFPALQMVWPDKQGHFPWEPAYDQSYSRFQLLLDK